jgi:hypothetical protein
MKYALMLKKRQQDARDERARILKRVEDDKIERRRMAAERKAEVNKAKDGSEPPKSEPSRLEPQTSSRFKECALQVRLFDGSTIRSRFPSSATLRVDVRPWIDEQQTGNAPYTFKHVLTPRPNRDISISDEEQSLESQGLAPTATLIIVPVQGYTSAYEDNSTSSRVSRGISAGFGLVSSGLGMVTGLFGSLLVGSTAPPPQEEPSASANTRQSPTINVRTLTDQNRPDEQQFYNGNAVSDRKLSGRVFN